MTGTEPLYMRILGDSWTQVAEPVRRLHSTCAVARAHGHLHVERGRSPVASVLARLLRLPRSSAAAETRLIITPGTGGEHWDRRFDGQRVETWQYETEASELAERFGILELRFQLIPSQGGLLYVQREAALRCWPFRLPIPPGWAPRVAAREDPEGLTRVRVDVQVSLPIVGPLITYHGVVDVEETPA